MKFKRNSSRKVKAFLDMTPMIDVVFQLLIFFMLSSTFVVQSSIPIEVPEASSAAEMIETDDVKISLEFGEGGPDGEGRVYLNDVEIQDWGEMIATLTDLTERTEDALVLIRPDESITTGRLIKVVDMIIGAGVTNYTIATRAPVVEE